jgi:DNA-binding CsgD family transcriptional regulator
LSRDSLSQREQEVLDELRNGGRVATIAQKLSISPTTVRNHLQRIFWKLGVHSQAELVEHLRQYPETPSDVDVEARYWQANQRLVRVVDAYIENFLVYDGLASEEYPT